jgi:hypothetical protein
MPIAKNHTEHSKLDASRTQGTTALILSRCGMLIATNNNERNSEKDLNLCFKCINFLDK